jgi:hypothetical protein
MLSCTNPYENFLRYTPMANLVEATVPDFCWQSAGDLYRMLLQVRPSLPYDPFKVCLGGSCPRGLLIRARASDIASNYSCRFHGYLYRRAP